MVRGGLKDRARPAARVLDPAPPLGRVLRCAPLWPTHTSPAAPISSRLAPRPWSSFRCRLTVDLSDCCCFHSLPRLGELVDQILFERQVALPPLPLDPEILEALHY
jgi:hypothetical protein